MLRLRPSRGKLKKRFHLALLASISKSVQRTLEIPLSRFSVLEIPNNHIFFARHAPSPSVRLHLPQKLHPNISWASLVSRRPGIRFLNLCYRDKRMSELSRIGVAIEADLLTKFDEFIQDQGYANRSEAFRDLIRDKLAGAAVQAPDAAVV